MAENADIITNMISNVGFPIVVSLGLILFGYKIFNNTFKTMTDELKTLKTVVENNNKLIDKLLDRLGTFWGNVEEDMRYRRGTIDTREKDDDND